MIKTTTILFVLGLLANVINAQNKKSIPVKYTEVSSQSSNASANLMIDGRVTDDSRWISQKEEASWIKLELNKKHRIGGLHIYSGFKNEVPIEDFKIQYLSNDRWEDIPSAVIYKNSETAISIEFDDTKEVITQSLKIYITKTYQNTARIKEIVLWPYTGDNIPTLGTNVEGWVPLKRDERIPEIYLNQSGFNIGATKRFTAPTLADGTSFYIMKEQSDKVLFQGTVKNHIGDFTSFNPSENNTQYIIKAGNITSFPFSIGYWWLEKVTYQNMVDFMIDSRHYVGTYKKKCWGSYGWRDDHHFGWELHSLVSQYLSNPGAYQRMPSQIVYEEPLDNSLWGKLEPYNESAPDIVKLIHWGTDVIVTQNLKHEHFKTQLAYFLYAWPWIKEWLPEQNYQYVKDYAFKVWADNDTDQKYPYDESKGHNLLALKTQIGTTKGALPPGFSVMPNLLLYEVANREERDDSEKYFKAAYNQVKWIIESMDWNDPQTTKGQRMSEHLTMSGLAYMYNQYEEKSPEGLKEKIEEWCQIMLHRSENMWDFRKLSDNQWTPTGEKVTMWNEPGNVLGFPACLLSALQVVDSKKTVERFNTLIYSHIDNAFGRNPSGRHCVYNGVKDIDGVDIGWYSFHKGNGQLQDVRFVIEATAKNKHYPYHPELGNIGWSEGWVNFNTAFNISMAYLAYHDTEISTQRKGKNYLIKLKAPLNFDYEKQEQVRVWVTNKKGIKTRVLLKEKGDNSEYFIGEVSRKIKPIEVSYGYGYFSHRASF